MMAPRQSLRVRLAVGTLVLTALGLALASIVGSLLLRDFLVTQVDRQLAGNNRLDRLGSSPQTGGGGPPGRQLPSPFVLSRVDATGQVIDQVRGTQATGAPAPDLSGLTADVVRALRGEPFDVSGVGDPAYSYRATATLARDGASSIVLAMSTEPIDATMQRAAIASLAVGALTLGLVGLLAGAVIRVGLRPLEEVELTAERIAAGDLTQRVPDMPAGTEVGRLAASLNGMLAQIESSFQDSRQSQDRLRRFVADASHELRTPLTTIRGYAELARTGALGDEAEKARAVGRIEEEAKRMGVLVDDLLLLARLDQHRPLEQAEVDLCTLVSASAAALRLACPDREISWLAGDPAVVIGDDMRLRQVIDNLASNAAAHTTEGSMVTFSVVADALRVRVVVADEGPGMTAEEVHRAFERFYRGDPSRTRRTGTGTGLGLYIAEAIIEAHGGALTLASSPAGGTSVTIDLPAAPVS